MFVHCTFFCNDKFLHSRKLFILCVELTLFCLYNTKEKLDLAFLRENVTLSINLNANIITPIVSSFALLLTIEVNSIG